MSLLFVVENVLVIKDRGVLATGKLLDPRARFRIGDAVRIRRQDGSVVTTAIIGIPMGMMKAGQAEVLLRGLGKSEVQPGDEVWLEDAKAEPDAGADRPRE